MTEPVFDDAWKIRNAVETCELMIEESVAVVVAIAQGRSYPRPSHRGVEYDNAYAQGRKDACRVILLGLTGREHITSGD